MCTYPLEEYKHVRQRSVQPSELIRLWFSVYMVVFLKKKHGKKRKWRTACILSTTFMAQNTLILSSHLVELIVVVHAYILRVDMCTCISRMCSAYDTYLIIINIINTYP